MTWMDLVRNLRSTFAGHRIRTFLTLLGVMIGTGSIVMLAGLLEGARASLLTLNQELHGSDTLRIRRDDPPADQRGRATRELSRRDGEALAASDPLRDVEVLPEARREARASYRGRHKHVRLVGADVRARRMYRLRLRRGRFIDEADLAEGRRVAVLGHEVHRELFADEPDPLGVQLTVDGEGWTVVGVLEHMPYSGHGSGTWMWDRRVIVPRVAFDATFTPQHEIQSVILRVRGRTPTARFMRTIGSVAEAILLRRHLGVKNFRLEERRGRKQEELIIRIIQALLLGTGLMALFVGGINIMNVMLVTVTERTREIGLRRALGATRRGILGQFVLEAVAFASVGGLLGVVGGVVSSWLIGLGLARFFGAWDFHLELWSVAVGLALALVTGVVFGLLPAWRAARLDPVEALRDV